METRKFRNHAEEIAHAMRVDLAGVTRELREEIRAALEGDSNDAEHDALVSVAEAFGIKWTSHEDREDAGR